MKQNDVVREYDSPTGAVRSQEVGDSYIEKRIETLEGHITELRNEQKEQEKRQSSVFFNIITFAAGGLGLLTLTLASFIYQAIADYRRNDIILRGEMEKNYILKQEEMKKMHEEKLEESIKYTKFYECIKNRKYWEYKLCTE